MRDWSHDYLSAQAAMQRIQDAANEQKWAEVEQETAKLVIAAQAIAYYATCARIDREA